MNITLRRAPVGPLVDSNNGAPSSKLWARLQSHFKSRVPQTKGPGFTQSVKEVVRASWLNILLVFIPISWAYGWSVSIDKPNAPLITFLTSFFAIIPLANLMCFATEELSLRVGETLGGLMNATLGNAVELIVAIIALLQCELRIVQSSLVGSILSNLLLVLGMCFFAGGTRFSEQGFGASASQLNSSLLVVSVIAVLLPAAFHWAISGAAADTGNNIVTIDPDQGNDILRLSRGVSIILLVTYAGYLVFQLWSHTHLYADNADDNFKSRKYEPRPRKSSSKKELSSSQPSSSNSSPSSSPPSSLADSTLMQPPITPASSEEPIIQSTNQDIEKSSADRTAVEPEATKVEEPKLSVLVSVGTLVLVTVCVAISSEFLVKSIDPLTKGGKISKEWVGLILLPIVGNAAEHFTAVTVSVKDKLTLSLSVAAGSSIQIALFVIPFMVTLAWMIGKPLTLLFDPFESITLFLAVLTVNYVTADGRTNWLEGMILINLYFIIGVMFWYYPGSDQGNFLAECVR